MVLTVEMEPVLSKHDWEIQACIVQLKFVGFDKMLKKLKISTWWDVKSVGSHLVKG